MKISNLKRLAVGLLLCVCMVLGLAACGSSSDDASDETGAEAGAEVETTEEDADSEDEDADSEDDEDSDDEDSEYDLILSLDDGTEIELKQFDEEDAYIYGKFVYETDGSMWVFGGDTLSVAFLDDDDEIDMDLYYVTFYEAVNASDEASSYLYVVLTDEFEGSSACWYALNVTDDDDNLEGIALVNPSDEDITYYLTVYEDDEDTDDEDSDEDSEDEDSDEEDEDSEDEEEDTEEEDEEDEEE